MQLRTQVRPDFESCDKILPFQASTAGPYTQGFESPGEGPCDICHASLRSQCLIQTASLGRSRLFTVTEIDIPLPASKQLLIKLDFQQCLLQQSARSRNYHSHNLHLEESLVKVLK